MRRLTFRWATDVVVVLAFVLAAWSLDPVRELSGLVAGRLPILLYAAAAAALASSWWRRSPRRLGALAGRAAPTAAVLSYLIPLFGGWETARSPYMIGGIIPWSDANLYFGGAQRILLTGGVDEYGAGRPIHTAFLAVRLAVTGMDLRKALVIGAVLLGIACFLAARAVARDLGPAAGLALFAGIYGFASPAGTSVMTEGLGVTFGALALATLWTAARNRNVPLALAGLVLMTVGQCVRTGALLVLPALAFWLAYHHRQGGHRLHWRVLGMAVAAGALGLALNVGAVVGASGRLASLHGHSGYFLYGLATGHPAWEHQKPNWTRVYADFPNATLTGADGASFVNDQAMRAIGDRPLLFARTVVKSGVNYLRVSHRVVTAPIRSGAMTNALAVLVLTGAAGALIRRRRQGEVGLATDAVLFGATIVAVIPLSDPWRVSMYPTGLFTVVTLVAFVAFILVGTRRISTRAPLSFAVAGLVGCALFAPLLGADNDSARNFAATVPMMALPLALAMGVLTRDRSTERLQPHAATRPEPGESNARRAVRSAPVLVGMGMLGATLFGTPVAAAMIDKPKVVEHRCPDGSVAHAFLGGVSLRVVEEGRGTENRRDALEGSILEKWAPNAWRLGPGTLPGTAASQTAVRASGDSGARTMLSVITAEGNDRIAYINGAVDAPETSVLYLCGQDEIDGISGAISRIFWPPPITFAYFTGSPLPG